ncbi:hypothetical protein LWI28_027969 [Acer negundo]|uniref:Uncharacterized protein n=1 Tax=Acer negundo TaxID=4023 RepID=A0AAD5NVX1_ACENE|nr:hypothetical protein LWI28_027969 [Acer negundo]
MVYGFGGPALGNLLDIEKRYDDVRGKYDMAKEVNSSLHDKIKHDWGLVEAIKEKFGAEGDNGQVIPDFDFSEFEKEVAAALKAKVKSAHNPIEDIS